MKIINLDRLYSITFYDRYLTTMTGGSNVRGKRPERIEHSAQMPCDEVRIVFFCVLKRNKKGRVAHAHATAARRMFVVARTMPVEREKSSRVARKVDRLVGFGDERIITVPRRFVTREQHGRTPYTSHKKQY